MKAILRVLRGLRDRIVLIVVGIAGPPIGAVRRLLARLRARVDGAVALVLKWWKNLWQAAPQDEKNDLGRPAITCPLWASGVLAILVYSWPSWTILPLWAFFPGAVVVWFVSLRMLQSASMPDAQRRSTEFLRNSAPRPGLLWWERLGLLAGIALAVAAVVAPHVAPLGLAVTYGFLRLLVTDYQLRELRSVVRRSWDHVPTREGEDGFEARDFSWTVNAGLIADDLRMTVQVGVEDYRRLKAVEPKFLWEGGTPRFDRWVVRGTTADVDRAAQQLHAIATERQYSTFAQISSVLAFVQSIPYVTDLESTGHEEYWRFPVESMYDLEGDCEDTSILAAAVLRQLGHRVGLFLGPGHAALAVEAPPGTPGSFVRVDGLSMYYCETTARGWSVGELPDSMVGQDLVVHLIR